MKLRELFRDLSLENVVGDMEMDVCGIQIDSRLIKSHELFIALRGTLSDGHAYVDKAIENGATAILVDTLPETLQDGITYIKVENTELLVGVLATRFNGDPTKHLRLVGVTGTNGKTTIATLLYNMFRILGYKVGLISTVCNYVDDEPVASTHTTPDPITLNKLLGRMVEAGCEYVFMEVSSHAVAQRRIGGLVFAGGIFTNLTRDHLDYHGTVANYLQAKKSFFDHLPKESFALTNSDEKNGMVMVQNTAASVRTYSLRGMADFKARILEDHFDGMILDIMGREVAVNFTGRFNASNLLAVLGSAVSLGVDVEEALRVLSMLRPVAGRFETVRSSGGVTGIVDYAHTPDAIANVLNAIREVLPPKAKVITVVGAGGNRDKGKRPLMASEAVAGSDRVVITSDNPRFEKPDDIIRDMLEGVTLEQRKNVLVISDRREAIRTACMLADKGDVVLLAGKGHETYQEVKGVKHHFDDKEVLKEAFADLSV